MNTGDIIFMVVVWIVMGFIACIVISENFLEETDEPGPVLTMAFFWPVSLPILIAFGVFYTVYASFRTGFSFFRSK